jgi:hypothetical protein
MLNTCISKKNTFKHQVIADQRMYVCMYVCMYACMHKHFSCVTQVEEAKLEQAVADQRKQELDKAKIQWAKAATIIQLLQVLIYDTYVYIYSAGARHHMCTQNMRRLIYVL